MRALGDRVRRGSPDCSIAPGTMCGMPCPLCVPRPSMAASAVVSISIGWTISDKVGGGGLPGPVDFFYGRVKGLLNERESSTVSPEVMQDRKYLGEINNEKQESCAILPEKRPRKD